MLLKLWNYYFFKYLENIKFGKIFEISNNIKNLTNLMKQGQKLIQKPENLWLIRGKSQKMIIISTDSTEILS